MGSASTRTVVTLHLGGAVILLSAVDGEKSPYGREIG